MIEVQFWCLCELWNLLLLNLTFSTMNLSFFMHGKNPTYGFRNVGIYLFIHVGGKLYKKTVFLAFGKELINIA